MTKRYKLLKEHPYAEIHSVWDETEWGTYRTTHMNKEACLAHIREASAPKDFVEKATSWFQEIKEPEKVDVGTVTQWNQTGVIGSGRYLKVDVDKFIPEDKLPSVKQAIENVLNETEIDILQREKFFKELQTWGRETTKWVESFVKRMPSSEPLYTQKQMDEAIKASFEAAKRVTDKKIGTIKYYSGGKWFVYEEKYPNIEDYLSSLKK